MIRRPPRSTRVRSSAASDVYKRQAPADRAPYESMESILLEAFSSQGQLLLPTTKNAERIFELRSYESPTENLLAKKTAMFNRDEINIFKRLGFNPVFMEVFYLEPTCL